MNIITLSEAPLSKCLPHEPDVDIVAVDVDVGDDMGDDMLVVFVNLLPSYVAFMALFFNCTRAADDAAL
jgi:hypothetical protein